MSNNITENTCSKIGDEISLLPTVEPTEAAMEENKGLKEYINQLNLEFLDLNAAMFEESNNMIRSADKQRVAAEKHAMEKDAESEMLRSQVAALKALISELSTNPLRQSISRINQNSSVTLRRPKDSFSPELSSDVPTPSMSRRNIVEPLSLRPSSSALHQPLRASRRDLLDALLSVGGRPKDADKRCFQEFVEWTKGGCELCIPYPTNQEIGDVSSTTGSSSRYRRVLVRRISQVQQIQQQKRASMFQPSTSDVDEDYADDQSQLDNSERGGSPTSALSVSGYSTSSQAKACYTSTTTTGIESLESCSAFMKRLYEEDVLSCLKFADPLLTELICYTLPSLSLELVPLARISVCLPVSPRSNNGLRESCPLMPGHSVKFQLKIRDPDIPQEMNKFGLAETVYSISAAARDRIVAVTGLFQYLSLIKRGLVQSTSESSNMNGADSSDDQLSEMEPRVRKHTGKEMKILLQQFSKIQRYRLAVAVARLGFGVPEVE